MRSRRYLQSGGVLDDFAAGDEAVAAAHYADIDAHNALHDQAVEDGLRQALEVALPAPAIATATGEPLGVPGENPSPLTPAQHRACAATRTCSWLPAPCFTRRRSRATAGDGCPVAAWGRLECPNAVFTERHLPSLTTFAAFLEDQREVLEQAQWQARYGMAHYRLTAGIFPESPAQPSTPPPAGHSGSACIASLPAGSWRL